MTNKPALAFRLTEDAKTLINALAKQLGVSKTDVLEMAIRKFAQAEGVQLPK